MPPKAPSSNLAIIAMRMMCYWAANLFVSTSVLAGEVSETTDPDAILQMESVQVTATRRPIQILEVAEAVTRVDAARISREAPRVLAELLRGQPGTFFQQTTPGQGIPIIRGLKGSEVLHLVDGLRLNNAFFRNAPNQYVALVDSYAVERMEVVRGAAPSLHGADAMGGVIQMLTWEPDFEEEAWKSSGRLYGSFNNVDSALVMRASGAMGKSGSALSGGITWQEYGDQTIGGGAVVSPTAFKVRAGDAKWRHALSPTSELMFSAQLLDQPATPRIDELVPGYGQEEASSDLYEFKPNRRSFLHARCRLEGQLPWFDRMEINLARQVIIDDRLTQETSEPLQITEDNKSTLDGITVQIDTPWGQAGSGQPALVWGIEYYTDTIASSRQAENPETGDSAAAPGRFPDDSSMDSLAIYAANRWQWSRLSLEAGLRFSAFDIYLPATDELAASRLDPTDLTGDVHISWGVKPGIRLVANAGRGFRPPNIFDLGTLGSRPGNRFNRPNPDLQPESVYSYDLGFKSAVGRWEAELFVFYSDYHDRIASVFTGETTPGGRLIVQSENLNRAKLYGIESGVSWYATPALNVYAVLNYTHGEEEDTEIGIVPADRVPPLNGRLGLVYESGNGFRLQPWIDLAARQDRLSPRDMEDPRIDPQGTPGYTLFNLLISWQVNPQLELGIRLENLGDKNYREHGSGIDGPGRNLGFWLDLRK